MLVFKPGASVGVCRRGGASAAFDEEDHYDDGARHVYPAGLGRDCWRVKEILDVGLNKE